MKKNILLTRVVTGLATLFMAFGMAACSDDEPNNNVNNGGGGGGEETFDGIELNKLVDAGYRTDNPAGAGNYEVMIGNCTSVAWEGDIVMLLDFYNEADSDPINASLPTGTYTPGEDYSPFTYGVSSTYAEIMMPDGEVVYSPLMGEITVEREGPNYTITVRGTLMMAGDAEFVGRYVGPIAFAQRGSADYERFDKPQDVTFEHSQGRYWGGWFYPFCDDLSMEFFTGEFDEDGNQTKGYYLHLGTFYMPKYSNYNEPNIPLAEGTYTVRTDEESIVSYFAQPYKYEYGQMEQLYGEEMILGVYLIYTDKEQNINKIGLVTGGTFTVSGSGDNTHLEFDFVTEEGVAITGSYTGPTNLMNYNDNDEQDKWAGRPWTSLTEDHTYQFEENAMCDAFLFGDYIRPGKDSWFLMIASYNENDEGYGDYFTTELMVDSSNGYNFPTGEFEITWEDKEYIMLPGFIDFGGSVLFTYYGDLTLDAEGYSSASAPIAGGKVTISQEGENYKFVFDMVDDGGNKITGEWTGPVTTTDFREEMKSSGDEDHDHTHSVKQLLTR